MRCAVYVEGQSELLFVADVRSCRKRLVNLRHERYSIH